MIVFVINRSMKLKKIKTIISGGQTGADRAAFDFALENQREIAGFIPKGRRAEDGKISEVYPNLIETAKRNYAERTELNVQNSDATLIVSNGKLSGGSLLTKKIAEKKRKPFRHVDLLETTIEESAKKTREWLSSIKCKNLNIAGPCASTDPEIYKKTKRFLSELFSIK
jgi:predicted Rossmann fold nucleotide-binding protein DprA/Smf involved in DNA uptake